LHHMPNACVACCNLRRPVGQGLGTAGASPGERSAVKRCHTMPAELSPPCQPQDGSGAPPPALDSADGHCLHRQPQGGATRRPADPQPSQAAPKPGCSPAQLDGTRPGHSLAASHPFSQQMLGCSRCTCLLHADARRPLPGPITPPPHPPKDAHPGCQRWMQASTRPKLPGSRVCWRSPSASARTPTAGGCGRGGGGGPWPGGGGPPGPPPPPR